MEDVIDTCSSSLTCSQATSRDERKRLRQPSPPISAAFSTTVKIKDVSHLTIVHPERHHCDLTASVIDVARSSALGAMAAGDQLLAKLWTTVLACFESGLHGQQASVAAPLESLTAEHVLQEASVLFRFSCGRSNSC